MTAASTGKGRIRCFMAYVSHRLLLCIGLAVLACPGLRGQAPPKSREQLEQQIDELQERLQASQRDMDAYRSELHELRQQFESLKARTDLTDSTAPTKPAADLQQAVADLKEQQAINQTEIQVQEQTKVETASKYPLKLHGLVLFNSAVINGGVDQATLPSFAIPTTGDAAGGSLTATGRQTILGVDASGPSFWGAHSYASLEIGFSGSTSSGSYNSGQNFLRLRTAAMQIAWPNTTVAAGVTPLLLTPYHATSYFSIAEPAMSWSGALWAWLPQLSVEQRIPLTSTRRITLQAALADIPDAGANAGNAVSQLSAGERSRYPGSEARAAFQWGGDRMPGNIGIGGYWSPHSYGTEGSLDAWAGTIDWKLTFPASLQFSGQFYTGSALGGLSAGAYKDYISAYREAPNLTETTLTGLKDLGGWTQIKFHPVQALEFNAAFGQDNADSGQLRDANLDLTNHFEAMARNQTFFSNIIYRPRATIVLSGEYRKLRTWQIVGPPDVANIFGLAAGYEF